MGGELVLNIAGGAQEWGVRRVMRAGLWDPERRVPRKAFAPMSEVFRDHCRLTTPLPDDEQMRAELRTEL